LPGEIGVKSARALSQIELVMRPAAENSQFDSRRGTFYANLTSKTRFEVVTSTFEAAIRSAPSFALTLSATARQFKFSWAKFLSPPVRLDDFRKRTERRDP